MGRGHVQTSVCQLLLVWAGGRKHINNMISRSGLLTNVIATIVASSRHLESVVNNIVAGVAGTL